MKIYDINEIAEAMQHVYPISSKNARGKDYTEIAEEYIQRTITVMLDAEMDDNNRYWLYINDISSHMDYRYNKGKKWYNWLRDNFPMFYVIYPGNQYNKNCSVVEGVFSSQQMLEYRLEHSALFKEKYWLPQSQGDVVLETKLDVENLKNYIIDANSRLTTENNNYQHKIRRNIKRAWEMLTLVKPSDGVLTQTGSFANNGRLHFTGINLQTTNKTVRHAALGACYKYDLSCASYAYRLGYIKHHAPHIKTPYLWQMIEFKTATRKKLAEECFENINLTPKQKLKLIKEVLNAIGFGMDMSYEWGDFAKIVLSKRARDQIRNHEYIKGLLHDLDQFNQVLEYNTDRKAAKKQLQLEKGERYSRNRWASYCYQRAESEIMQHILQQHEIASKEQIYWVHDAVYTRKKVGVGTLNYYLHQHPYWQFAKFEEEQIKAWQNPETIAEIQQAELDHLLRIREEELCAENYASSYVTVTHDMDNIDALIDIRANIMMYGDLQTEDT